MDVVTRFTLAIGTLCKAVATRGAEGAFPSNAITILLWNRLSRTILRFTALVRDARNNVPPPPIRPGRSRPALQHPVQPPQSRPPTLALPRRFGWLFAPVPDAAALGSQLAHLLIDPELIAMIEADYRFGRLLRPLCHTLGICLPPCLQLPKPAPRKRDPSPAAERRAAARRLAEQRGAELQASKPNPPFRLRLGSAGQAERDPRIYHQLYFHPPPKCA
ncbi:MAG: hypothetical protein ACYCZB_00015 [Acidiphilium sp.]